MVWDMCVLELVPAVPGCYSLNATMVISTSHFKHVQDRGSTSKENIASNSYRTNLAFKFAPVSWRP